MFKFKSISIKKLFTKSRGLSPIIATILILGLVTAGVVVGFVQVLPYIERSRVETASASVKGSLINVDNTIWDMISDAGLYIPGNYPTNIITLNLPLGYLTADPDRNSITYSIYRDGNPLPSFPVTANYGSFTHQFDSTYELIPEYSIEYLSGSNPLQEREIVAESRTTGSSTEELTMTNLTLSRRGYTHYVDLNYRPKVIISQSVENGNPVYNIGLFLINIDGTGEYLGSDQMSMSYQGSNIIKYEYDEGVADEFYIELIIGSDSYQAALIENLSLDQLNTRYIVTVVTHNIKINS